MNYEYKIHDKLTAEITGILSPDTEIHIPDRLGGCPVTEIGSDLFLSRDKSTVEKVFIPKGVKTIHPRAFCDLHYLKYLQLPETLQTLGEYAVYTCPDLLRLSIPMSVKEIGPCAFGYMYEHSRNYLLRYFQLVCSRNSAAEGFAIENGISYCLMEEGAE